jgi:trehalose-phosphatase
VQENDIYKWISDIIKEILRSCAGARKSCAYLFDHLDDIRGRLKGIRPMLFLDYDGTLTPIVSSPDKAVLAKETRGLIAKLKETMGVAIISGRGLMDTKERVGIEDLIYAGNHGAEIWDGEKVVVSQNISANRLLLNDFLVRLKEATDRFHGILIEDKGATASIHYRLLKPKEFAEFFNTFSTIAADYEDLFNITSGKKVFEVRPLGMWNKGDAVSWITKQAGPKSMAIYVGDDTTDEDAFRAIEGTGISISIGKNPKADYYLKSQKEIKDFLKEIRGLTARC